ncbi:MAG: TRAP transporter substrate-binding protein DctP [Synergistaceae bacterium]|jgi:TRAP-type C4-dicarboxylate transport system substrate-binding protein|nr:TRAP transporter substrate-binding protein DctP [Synergistaceae bacterium]
MMKMKKAAFLILALAMVLTLGARGGNSGQQSTTTPPPSGSGETYTLSYASNNAPGSDRYDLLEQVFANLMHEKSNGRITVELYPSGSLSAPGKTLDGIKNGTVDTGIDSFTRYSGQYPYFELLTTPAHVFGTPEEFNQVLVDFVKAFPDAEAKYYKIIVLCDAGDFGLVSTTPLKTVEDIKGKSVRNTANFIPLLNLLGASSVSLPSSEMYEALKLNTINASNTTDQAIPEFHLEEVCNYFTRLAVERSDFMIVMNLDLYNGFDDELKAAVDAVCEEMKQVSLNYLYANNEHSRAKIKENAKFEYVTMDDAEVKKLVDIAKPLLETKAAELDAAGLDGTGALKWLRARYSLR